MVIRCPSEAAHLLMGDWLHCNICFHQPGKGPPFHITSCGHTYCERCLVKGTTKSCCKMCGCKCTTIELSGKMKPDVQMFFQDPVEQLNKAFKKFNQTWEFQRNHRRRFFNHLTSKVSEQNQMLMEAKKMLSTAKAMERETMKLKEENIYLKKLVQEKGIGSNRPSPRSGVSSASFGLSPAPSQSSRSSTSHTGYSSQRPGSSLAMHRQGVGSAVSSLASSSYGRPSQLMHTQASSSYGRPSQLMHTQTPTAYGNGHTPQGPFTSTPDRILARTPPSGGRMGTVGIGSPADHMINMHHKTPMSVPHPISFHGTPDLME